MSFAARRSEDYSYASHWVSHLGAVGQPHASTFNLFAFVIPGLLAAALAFALGAALKVRLGPILLALSGLALILVGLLPLRNPPGALANHLHSYAANFCGLSFGAAVVVLSAPFRQREEFAALGKASSWFVAFVILYPAAQLAWQQFGLTLSGLGQRTALAGYFLWLTLAGCRLFRYNYASRETGARAPMNRRRSAIATLSDPQFVAGRINQAT